MEMCINLATDFPIIEIVFPSRFSFFSSISLLLFSACAILNRIWDDKYTQESL